MVRRGLNVDIVDLEGQPAAVHEQAATMLLEEFTEPHGLEFTAPFDRAFAEIGARIFTRAGFELGIIGEETSGKYSSTSFGKTDLPFTGFLLPEPLWGRVEAVSAAAETVAPGLRWLRPGPA